jgi:hypothetical protein
MEFKLSNGLENRGTCSRGGRERGGGRICGGSLDIVSGSDIACRGVDTREVLSISAAVRLNRVLFKESRSTVIGSISVPLLGLCRVLLGFGDPDPVLEVVFLGDGDPGAVDRGDVDLGVEERGDPGSEGPGLGLGFGDPDPGLCGLITLPLDLGVSLLSTVLGVEELLLEPGMTIPPGDLSIALLT